MVSLICPEVSSLRLCLQVCLKHLLLGCFIGDARFLISPDQNVPNVLGSSETLNYLPIQNLSGAVRFVRDVPIYADDIAKIVNSGDSW